jgi:glycosyltransferase involved in cell wall biosynthesis
VQPKVDILLATYQGAAYLEEQLESLIDQDYPHFSILIRDDGSKDKTLEIIKAWEKKYPAIIRQIPSDEEKLGATGNFNALMLASTADYIAFSDQDDRWLPGKVSEQMKALLNLEDGNQHTPAFVFCDLKYCDASLNVIHPSLNQKDHLDPHQVQTHQLLMQNVPYGCAMMINRALLKAATPVPKTALLHDHWLALSASLLGKISYQPEALLLHRVHSANASRAASEHKQQAGKDLGSKISNQNFHNYLFKQTAQAKALLQQYQALLSAHQICLLEDFIRLETTSGLERKRLILKNRFFKNTFAQTLKLILRA